MKKVLIMSASTGGGHNRAAKAIQEDLELKFINGEPVECKIIDSLKLINNFTDKVISRGYEKSAMYTPEAYGSIYRLSDTQLVSKNEYKDNPLISLLAKKLKTLILEENPDLIIGTHPFPMIALSKLKKISNEKKVHSSSNKISEEYSSLFHWNEEPVAVPPLISILTDYTVHSTHIQNEIDYYIVGHEYVKELLVSEGAEPERIKAYGIPVEKSFLLNRDKETVLKELNLSTDKKTIVLMGGSFGAGNIKETLEELIQIDRDFQILVITGRNKSLKEKIEKKLANYECEKNIQVLGFTDKMNDILSAVDFIVTKPGGLTTTETLLKGVPMIVPYYIPGQEEENLDFLSNCGAVIRVTKKYTLSVLLKVLLDHPERVELLKKNISSIKKVNSAQNIANLSKEIMENQDFINNNK
ncbi:MGDG synthase family glycosyltransferase [Peptacetobacter sp.]|uniref:MGDG synthase family glycosyltransferase n=1 Tax=Peptacetobacter sp. TaxID=2991975 RepID=UPI0026030983|nr:glycosyltransferase [Peptacetobacter sp.]